MIAGQPRAAFETGKFSKGLRDASPICLRTGAELGTHRLPTDPAPELSLEALRQNWPELWDGYCLLDELSETDLSVELTTVVPGGAEVCVPGWKILRHVLDHSTLHRGQIVGMIRTLGDQPLAVHRMDYYLATEPAVL